MTNDTNDAAHSLEHIGSALMKKGSFEFHINKDLSDCEAMAYVKNTLKCVNAHNDLVTNLKETIWQIKRMSQILERNGLNGALKDTDGPILRAELALEKAGVEL